MATMRHDAKEPAPVDDQKKLVKTLTFGIGKPHAWNDESSQPIELDPEVMKKVFGHIQRASEAFAHACNIAAAHRYVKEVLGVAKKDPDLNSGNKALRRKSKDSEMLSGGVLSQTEGVVKAQFTGEHGKALLLQGSRQLPTFRTDGTSPIPVRADITKLRRVGDEFYLVVQLFSEEWAKHEQVPHWLAFRIKAKPRDRTLRSQLDKTFRGEWEKKSSRILPKTKTSPYRGQLMVEFTPSPFKPLQDDVVMGIDLG